MLNFSRNEEESIVFKEKEKLSKEIQKLEDVLQSLDSTTVDETRFNEKKRYNEYINFKKKRLKSEKNAKILSNRMRLLYFQREKSIQKNF